METTYTNEIICGLPGEVLWKKNRSFPIFLSIIFLSMICLSLMPIIIRTALQRLFQAELQVVGQSSAESITAAKRNPRVLIRNSRKPSCSITAS